MKKNLLIAFGIITTLTFMSVIVYQTDVITNLRSSLLSETQRADHAELELGIKSKMVDELNAENARLKDSIEVLTLEVATLHQTITDLKSTILKLNKTIKSHETRVAKLTREISNLEKKGTADRQKISALEKERSELLVKMEEYDGYRRMVMEQREQAQRKQEAEHQKLRDTQSKLEANAKVQDSSFNTAPPIILNQPPALNPQVEPQTPPSPMVNTIKNEQQERLLNIKANTSVEFIDITLRKKETGNDLKKIDPKDWRYTFIEFDLNNPRKDLLLEETFVLQLFDLDHNQVVPMNESNPEFPDSEQGRTGYKFRYKGTPVSIRYFNNQRKEGANYEIRIYYFKGGLFFLLDQGKKLIVQRGDVLPPR